MSLFDVNTSKHVEHAVFILNIQKREKVSMSNLSLLLFCQILNHNVSIFSSYDYLKYVFPSVK